MYLYILLCIKEDFRLRTSSLHKAKPEIQAFFNSQEIGVFRPDDLKKTILIKKNAWKLSKSITLKRFIGFLLKEHILKLINIKFPYLNITRYIKHNASILEISSSLKNGSYLSHYSSVYIHELTEQIPKAIYLNFEQPEKLRSKKSLNQKNIDFAFRRPWRISNNLARFSDYNIYLLNGMYTGKLGVIDFIGPNGERIKVTDVERTLIDIAVRPVYSGGIFEVLKAYRSALPILDMEKLIKYLKKLDFIYPYHQAIGFYFEKAGYDVSKLELFRDFGLNYDFYLTHQIKNREYSKKWRLYYPKGF